MFEKQRIEAKILQYGISLIALLWFYAGISKLMDYRHFTESMQKQPFQGYLTLALIYGLPPAELIAGTGLLIRPLRKLSLYFSAFLFLVFTLYIALILMRIFGQVPCSCGGLIEHMGWKFHLGFNLAFLAINFYLIMIDQRKEYSDK